MPEHSLSTAPHSDVATLRTKVPKQSTALLCRALPEHTEAMTLSIKEYFASAGSKFTKDDAQVIGPVLTELAEQGQMTDATIVEVARSANSPLHAYFEWDDQKAANYYRLGQAQEMVREIRVRLTDGHAEPIGRTLKIARPSERHGSKGGAVITLDGEGAIAAQRMDDALKDLRYFREKYEPYLALWDRFKRVLGPLADEAEQFIATTRRGAGVEPIETTLTALADWRDKAAPLTEIWDLYPDEFRRLLDLIAEAEDMASRTDKRKSRNCLRCGTEFVSFHAGHRLCDKCRPAVNRDDIGLDVAVSG